MINDVRLLIDGKFIKSDAKEKLSVINPARSKSFGACADVL